MHGSFNEKSTKIVEIFDCKRESLTDSLWSCMSTPSFFPYIDNVGKNFNLATSVESKREYLFSFSSSTLHFYLFHTMTRSVSYEKPNSVV
jgi:hypothetical protein